MQEYKAKLEDLKSQVDKALAIVDVTAMRSRLVMLEAKMQESGFWDNAEVAASVSKEVANLSQEIDTWEKIEGDINDMMALVPMDFDKEFDDMMAELESRWERISVATYLSGKFDRNNAVLSVICGTGGKDAQDFTQMLFRMYSRYAELAGFKAEVLDITEAEEVGLKNATILISGEFAYGKLKFEHGVHRLVRLSPFNSGNTRETSFAKVDVIPEVEFDQEVEIDDKDLKIDTYRASGAGGQHVNTTDSAVRITHVPTGIVVQCQNERSQAQNKETAMKMLQGRLQTLMEERQVETIDDLRGQKVEVSWGNQIRSYVLHPYKMVKDHRTEHEESNPDKVLDGEIDGFIDAELKVLTK